MKSIFEGLNSAQEAAVRGIDGPSLIIAGAGSGKTRVLTCKIANIIENGAAPREILALTFTNKAAAEMKERIALSVGQARARWLWMGTFHSIFARFLRDEAELLGFPKNFTIHDTTDSRNVIKSCIKELQLDDKIYKPQEVQKRISHAKNNLVTPKAYLSNGVLQQEDLISKRPRIVDIYQLYWKRCKMTGVMDFDDLLLYTNILFRDFPDALERIRSRFRYILVDEFQDTNMSQYLIVRKLSSVHRNITVVGDDAQSIYAFRGARIENILNFKKDFPDAAEYKLDQNYRSTKVIVEAANSLINNNKAQFQKACFSRGEEGEKIELLKAVTDQEEGVMIANSISDMVRSKSARFSDVAVLYRTNAQSRIIEEALRRRNIPYRIYQGHSFYERAEVKDMLAYLRLIVNPQDDEAFYRIVNFPARGIGDTTLQRVRAWSAAKEKAAVELINEPGYEEFGLKESVIAKLRDFVSGIMELREQLSSLDAFRMAVAADMKFGIRNSMKSDKSLEEQAKLENVEELFNSIEEFVEEGEEQLQGEAMEEGLEPMEEQLPQLLTLDLYLQKVALISDSDTKEAGDDNNKVSLMTVHTSKGLEFPYVIVAGMEEGMIPAVSSLSPESELEEERRVFYVAMTRAGRVLKLSYAASRMKFGSRVSNPPSRFIKEIGERYLLNPIEREYGSGALQGVPLRGGAPFRQGGSFSQGGSFRQGGSFSQSSSFKQSSSLRQSGSLRPGVSIRQSGGLQQQAAAPKSNFVADSPLLFKEGMRIEHERFGEGRILSMEGSGVEKRAIVLFDSCGEKKLLLKYARIRIVKEQ